MGLKLSHERIVLKILSIELAASRSESDLLRLYTVVYIYQVPKKTNLSGLNIEQFMHLTHSLNRISESLVNPIMHSYIYIYIHNLQ